MFSREMEEGSQGASRWGELVLATERAKESVPELCGIREGARAGGPLEEVPTGRLLERRAAEQAIPR